MLINMDYLEANNLWQRFKDGDDEALSALYICYLHQLYSYGLKIHGDESLVKDCIQEVFIQLINRRKKISTSEFTTVYLFKSLRNQLLEELRTKTRRSDIVRSITVDDKNYEVSPEQTIMQSEEERSRVVIMNTALSKLSDYQREALFLKYSQDLEYEKIAELLEIDISSARTLIYRSLKKVKQEISTKTQLILLLFRTIFNSDITKLTF